MRWVTVASIICSVALFGCERPAELEAERSGALSGTEVMPGTWRAVVELPGGELPFFIELVEGEDGWRAWFLNGQERVTVTDPRVDGGHIRLEMSAFNTWIDARMQDGRMVGDLTLVKRYGEQQVMPFSAALGPARRFSQTPSPAAADVSGRWSVEFVTDEGERSPAVAEFRQFGHEVTGTFLTPLGDYRYLAGEVQDGRLRLSTFDGSHAFLFHAALAEDGSLSGDFWSGTRWHERWTAVRDPDARLPDADSLTSLKPGYDRFGFSFPDLEGETVSLSDPRFQGKVVLVTLAGSWCPNCHDEAQAMAPLYREYRDQGLEIVALMYEHLEDRDAAVEQVRRFRRKFGIEYVTLLAGISDKTQAAETLPMLDAVLAFPTTIFIDREGEVRRIHTGFSGPGTGEHHEALMADIRAEVERLLAEPAEG